ncbi:DUF1064 domain-containing protein [Escherichia coli]
MRKQIQALGRLKTGQMNKTESAYCQHLELRKRAGEIVWYRFEGIKLRLADNTFYTPDFAVMLATGEMELHEVKGFWTDDARVKTKVAADQYPFRIIAAENELARKAVQAFCDVVGDNTEVIAEVVGRDGVLVILEAMKATGNMPATDAFLAEVRAQGVELLREHPAIQICSLTHVCDEFAAQLRQGEAV